MTYETCNKTDCTGCTVCLSGTAQAVQSYAPLTEFVDETDVPAGVKGWCWGGFLLSWIWAIGSGTRIGLLSAIPWVVLGVSILLGDNAHGPVWTALLSANPYVALGMAIWLGIKGRELAWKSGDWGSVEQFNRVQRSWTKCGVVIYLLLVAAVLIACVWFVSAVVSELKNGNHSFRIG